MGGRVAAERVIATSNVAAFSTTSQVKPPTPGLETFHATGPTRRYLWIDVIRHISPPATHLPTVEERPFGRHVRPLHSGPRLETSLHQPLPAFSLSRTQTVEGTNSSVHCLMQSTRRIH